MISHEEIVRTITEVSSFPTRHTLTPGYQEACDWLEERFSRLGLTASRIRTPLPAGPRIPQAMEADQVMAVLPGESKEAILIGAHLDSLNLEGPPAEVRAPGANDNGSGLAVMLECARCLAGRSLRRSVVFVGFAAEEQGLLGAKHLSAKAREEDWPLRAVLTSDMVGSPWTGSGKTETFHIRCFSAEGQSRELARWIEWTSRSAGLPFGVKLVLRHDRFGRGGDHTPFDLQGFPSVRFTEARENYGIQHSSQDVTQNLDPSYIAQTAQVNLLALERLATADPGPSRPRIVRDQSHHTTLEWDEPGEVDIYWRDTRSATWEGVTPAEGTTATLKDLNKDDHFFAIGGKGDFPIPAA